MPEASRPAQANEDAAGIDRLSFETILQNKPRPPYCGGSNRTRNHPRRPDRMATTTTRSETAFTHEQFADAYPEGMENHFWYVARNGMVSDTIGWIENRQQRPVVRRTG
jgi:hypothetical protein